MTTYEDLKQAIESMPKKPIFTDYIGDDIRLYDNHMRAYFEMERYVWRTYAMFLEERINDFDMGPNQYYEIDRAKALVKEKLA